MGKVCESYLDFMAPLETTSTALNGLLKVDGPLTVVREIYSLDIKRDIQKKKDEELSILYSQVLANAKNAQFRLVRVNDGVTRLYYRLEKRSYTVLLIFMIIFQIFLSGILDGWFIRETGAYCGRSGICTLYDNFQLYAVFCVKTVPQYQDYAEYE